MDINQGFGDVVSVYGRNRTPKYRLYADPDFSRMPNIQNVMPNVYPQTPDSPVEPIQMPTHPEPILGGDQQKKPSMFMKNLGSGLKKLGGNFSAAVGFAGAIGNAFSGVKNQNELLSDAGTSNAYINGIAYQQQNAVDSQKEMSELSKENTSNTLSAAATGATLGASLGPIGAVAGGVIGGITGLFGGAHRKKLLRRKIFNAQQLAQRTNNSNMASANSDYLAQNEGLKYGTNTGAIFQAYHGKDRGMQVESSVGRMLGRPNARVARDESIVDNIDNPLQTTGHIVKRGRRGVDGPTARVSDDTIIFGNDVDRTNGIKFMDQAAPFTAAIEMINKKYGQK